MRPGSNPLLIRIAEPEERAPTFDIAFGAGKALRLRRC